MHRGLGGNTVRHRLSSLASLFEYLCDQNAVTRNPVKGVARPKVESAEGPTPALGDHQARKLLDAPNIDSNQRVDVPPEARHEAQAALARIAEASQVRLAAAWRARLLGKGSVRAAASPKYGAWRGL